MKRLFLIRHAKAERPPGLSDPERPLSKRGLKNAPEMALRLQRKGLAPDLILSSPARRALDTARLFALVFHYPESRILIKEEMYASSPQTLLNLINAADASCQRLFLFGHNPEFSLLASYLADPEDVSLPTCGIAMIDFEVDDWSMVSMGLGSLRMLDYPKRSE